MQPRECRVEKLKVRAPPLVSQVFWSRKRLLGNSRWTPELSRVKRCKERWPVGAQPCPSPCPTLCGTPHIPTSPSMEPFGGSCVLGACSRPEDKLAQGSDCSPFKLRLCVITIHIETSEKQNDSVNTLLKIFILHLSVAVQFITVLLVSLHKSAMHLY